VIKLDNDVINKVYDLIDEIKSHQTYVDMKDAKAAIDASREVRALSEHFKKAEQAYNNAKQYGKHHPDFERYKNTFQRASRDLFSHPLVKKYKANERALNQLLEHISEQLAQSVSSTIKVDKDLAFYLGG